ncbi:cupin domain-containing protein [Desulfovibrio intestinalis]|uniref:Quercetin dioxygenase-like cupin family protein n=1 Tax=Desulfovibrio intestinalis TaxID=58621 RepID=A0A7W8FG90_9BACT|nr:cupin domain-containing protein [Desulfovibrio intestinalis]MBB5143525.1 quercetin dioxygenase-like cupin family protein [Desulfovibrio intestinalis]
MIYRADALDGFEKEMFGGPGAAKFTKIVNEDGLADKGRLFSHVHLKPGCAVGSHKHSGEMEIYYVLKGQGTYNDNGTDMQVKAGDVTVCNDGEVHGILNSGTDDMEMIALILFTK